MRPTIRASDLDRVLSCNGSLTLVPMVAPRESDEGDEGTYLHWLIAKRLIEELGATAPEGGLPPPDVPAGYKLPANAAWIVHWAVRRIQERVPVNWSLLVEVPLAYAFPDWDNSGHIDWLAISPDATEAIGGDYKTGRDPVDPADNNWQTFDYMCLAKRAWPSLRIISFEIDQPRVTEEDDVARISTSILEGDNLEVANETLDAAVRTAIENRHELNTGKQCAYCIGCSCPAIRKLMKLQITPELLAEVTHTPSDAVLGDFVADGRLLAKPLKDATELLHARLDTKPEVVTGAGQTFTRKIERSGYEITEPVPFFQLAKSILLTDERMAAVYKPSFTRLGDELAEVLNVPRTGNAPVTVDGVLDQFKVFAKQGERRLLKLR